jgi:hypothetical protein
VTSDPRAAGILELPAIYGELSLGARAAYGAWLLALFGLVSHTESCPFGCQPAGGRCSDGVYAFDDEREHWEAWRDARERES